MGDIAIVIATLMGPVLAVQVQKLLERRRNVKDRQLQIFRVLMTTRATSLSPAHVEALNAVPVEFYGPRKADLKAITDDWHLYLDHLNQKNMSEELWSQKRKELLVSLLYRISIYLNYKFNKSEIEKDVYYPSGHAEIESDQTIIRRGFAKLISGGIDIPISVKALPTDSNILEEQAVLRKLLRQMLDGTGTLNIKCEPASEAPDVANP